MHVFSQRIAEGGILPWLLVIAALLQPVKEQKTFVLYVKGFICFMLLFLTYLAIYIVFHLKTTVNIWGMKS